MPSRMMIMMVLMLVLPSPAAPQPRLALAGPAAPAPNPGMLLSTRSREAAFRPHSPSAAAGTWRSLSPSPGSGPRSPSQERRCAPRVHMKTPRTQPKTRGKSANQELVTVERSLCRERCFPVTFLLFLLLSFFLRCFSRPLESVFRPHAGWGGRV